jgi:hypothetical protein
MKAGRKLLLAAALVLSGAFAHVANAETVGPTQTVFAYPCTGCSTYSQLHSGAHQVTNTAPYPANGDVLLMIGTAGSASAYFRVGSYMMCSIPTYPYYYYCSSGGTVVRYVSAITLTAAEAQALDEQLIAKAIGRVTIPAQYGTSAHSALAEDINSGLRNVVPIALSFTGKYFIPLNGKPVQVFPNLTEIDVVFPDGTKVTMRLGADPRASVAWIFVRAVDANGNTITPNSGGGTGGGGGGTPSPPPPRQPDPHFYCPVQVISNVCIMPTASGGQCPQNSAHIDIFLRPC